MLSKKIYLQITNSQKLPRNNHYIPQFYLRCFSTDSERIYRLDKRENTIKHLSISSVGFEKNIYTYREKNGEISSLEPVFLQVEGLAASCIRKLKAKENISDQEKSDLSFFLSLQMVRTPSFQNNMEAAQKELMEKTARMTMRMSKPEYVQRFFQKKGKQMSLKEAENVLEFGSDEKRSSINITYPKEYGIRQMLQLSMDFTPIFQICDWELRHSVTPYGFLTSDNPFMLIPGEKPDPFFSVGLLTPKVKKVVPLTAGMCLIAHEPQKDPVIIHNEADKNYFGNINKLTIKNAERYVFGPSSGKIEKIVKFDQNVLKTPQRYSIS